MFSWKYLQQRVYTVLAYWTLWDTGKDWNGGIPYSLTTKVIWDAQCFSCVYVAKIHSRSRSSGRAVTDSFWQRSHLCGISSQDNWYSSKEVTKSGDMIFEDSMESSLRNRSYLGIGKRNVKLLSTYTRLEERKFGDQTCFKLYVM